MCSKKKTDSDRTIFNDLYKLKTMLKSTKKNKLCGAN